MRKSASNGVQPKTGANGGEQITSSLIGLQWQVSQFVLAPVIPAKAGIQRVEARFAI